MICHLLSINEEGRKKTWEVGSLMTMEELQPKKQELGAKRNAIKEVTKETPSKSNITNKKPYKSCLDSQEKKLKGLWKTIYYIHITYIERL
jgi:hypothetical protein